jgi:hypothetical protein
MALTFVPLLVFKASHSVCLIVPLMRFRPLPTTRRCLGLGDPIGCLAPLLEQGIQSVASALPGEVNGDWAGGDCARP